MYKPLVKNLLYPLHEKIMGRKTIRYMHDLEQSQYLSPGRLEELKFLKLQALLIHAGEKIPFYRDRFLEAGLDPRKMGSIQDLHLLPLLSKKEIRDNLPQMTWGKSPGGLTRYNTGGSSGNPLVFYFDRRRQAFDAAARALTHRWWGIEIGDRELYLWGSPLEIGKQDLIKSLRDRLTNELLISAFEISEAMVPKIMHQIQKFKPDCLFGYPSTITLFCEMAEKQNYRLDKSGIKTVFSAAEVLYDHQREKIGEAFGKIPVVDSYGSREAGFISHECRSGKHHIIEPNFIIEFIKNEKDVKPGEDGEIVTTHLDAWGMPFIRYRTGDVAQPGEGDCSCGLSWGTMEKIKGRTTDFIVTPDGRWQHALSLIYVVRDIKGVQEFKIFQEDVDDVRVQIMVRPDHYPHDGNSTIINGFKKRMGKEVQVTIEQVDKIPRDASGKYRYVLSKVSQQGLN